MLSYDRLVHEHLAIEGIAADLLLHAADRPIDAALVAQARWLLSRHLLAHLAKEDALLYPMLQRSPDAQTARLAASFANELGGLGAAFKAYMLRWTSGCIAEQSDAFEADTASIVTALRDRIHREETQLYRHIPGAPPAGTVDAGARAA